MSTLLIIGSAVGVIIGLVHAGYVYFQRTKEDPKKLEDHPLRVRANAAYFALWTLALWVVDLGRTFSQNPPSSINLDFLRQGWRRSAASCRIGGVIRVFLSVRVLALA